MQLAPTNKTPHARCSRGVVQVSNTIRVRRPFFWLSLRQISRGDRYDRSVAEPEAGVGAYPTAIAVDDVPVVFTGPEHGDVRLPITIIIAGDQLIAGRSPVPHNSA